jgi:hypothetical protein
VRFVSQSHVREQTPFLRLQNREFSTCPSPAAFAVSQLAPNCEEYGNGKFGPSCSSILISASTFARCCTGRLVRYSSTGAPPRSSTKKSTCHAISYRVSLIRYDCNLNACHTPSSKWGLLRSPQCTSRIICQISYRRECSGKLHCATFLTLPRAFFLFLVEVKILVPFLCLALLPFGRPDSTNRSSHFSLVFDTPNAFAVSSAVANFESRTIVILILSFYDTLIHPGEGAPNSRQKKREPTSPPPLKRTAAISYLWPECVIRARMSRRLSSTVEAANSARSAGLHLLIVALMACAHLSMLSALG